LFEETERVADDFLAAAFFDAGFLAAGLFARAFLPFFMPRNLH
jgi:hypothetical protein